MSIHNELVKEAIELYGRAIVHEVLQLVSLADPDGVHSMFEDLGMIDHVEVIEFLYFDMDH